MLKNLYFIQKILLNKYLLGFVFMLSFILLLLIVWSTIWSEYIKIDLRSFILVKMLLIYVNVFILIEILKTYDKEQFKIWKKFWLIKFWVLFLILAILKTKWFDIQTINFILITIFFILFFIDSRIIFFFALNYFIYTAFYTVLWYKELATDIANHFYYFFIIGMIALMSEQILLHRTFK